MNKTPRRIRLSRKSKKLPSSVIGKSPKKNPVWIFALLIIVSGVLIGTAVYIIILLLTPKIGVKSAEEIKKVVQETTTDQNMLFVPSAGVAAEIAEGDVRILDEGKVWHRFPDRGNPKSGGNTILTGHSFVWGYTPKKVKDQSIFYNLAQAKVGDEVTVRWDEKNYHYRVTEIKTVKPNEVSIEAPSKDPKLTIYTCTLAGSLDGRVVVIAKPQ